VRTKPAYWIMGWTLALIRIAAVCCHNGGHILEEKLYAKRLTGQSLATSIKLLPSAPVVAGSAESRSLFFRG
jgi:hypothetical protein